MALNQENKCLNKKYEWKPSNYNLYSKKGKLYWKTHPDTFPL